MSTITKEQAQSVSDLKAGYTLGHADVTILNELARIALASLEAEPAIHRWRRVTAEPYGPYPWHYGNFICFSKPVDGIEDEYYYTAPPAPVSVPDMATPKSMRAIFCQLDDSECAIAADVWNACRAAMLQGAAGNSPAIPDRWIPVSERMPEKGQKVFYYFDIVGVHAGYYDGDNTFVNENGGGWLTGDVTHWMEWNMPAAPNREVK